MSSTRDRCLRRPHATSEVCPNRTHTRPLRITEEKVYTGTTVNPDVHGECRGRECRLRTTSRAEYPGARTPPVRARTRPPIGPENKKYTSLSSIVVTVHPGPGIVLLLADEVKRVLTETITPKSVLNQFSTKIQNFINTGIHRI